MPAFEWLPFFDRYRIEFRDHGPNVGKNHVVVRCPFCNDDPGMHLSISLDGKGWRCFRNHAHAGISPIRLIQALARIDWHTAVMIGGREGQQQYIQPSSILERVNNLLGTSSDEPETIEFPETARLLDDPKPSAKPYQLYMQRRGFTNYDLTKMVDWDVRFDNKDPRFHGRILFGTRHQGQLVAMTGRAIGDRMEPRYLAAGDPKRALLWAHRMLPLGRRMLVLTEGPFDALKVNILGNHLGIYATCAFTSSFGPELRAQLFELIPRFRSTVVLFDRGNEHSAYELAAGFPARIGVAMLPSYAKDPAELHSVDWLLEDQ